MIDPGAGVRSVQTGPTPVLLGATMLRAKLMRLLLFVTMPSGSPTADTDPYLPSASKNFQQVVYR